MNLPTPSHPVFGGLSSAAQRGVAPKGETSKPAPLTVSIKALDNGFEVKHGGGALDGQTHAASSAHDMHAMVAKHFGHGWGTAKAGV